jgi:hypothetical protein
MLFLKTDALALMEAVSFCVKKTNFSWQKRATKGSSFYDIGKMFFLAKDTSVQQE